MTYDIDHLLLLYVFENNACGTLAHVRCCRAARMFVSEIVVRWLAVLINNHTGEEPDSMKNHSIDSEVT